jgi:hypothetical protein
LGKFIPVVSGGALALSASLFANSTAFLAIPQNAISPGTWFLHFDLYHPALKHQTKKGRGDHVRASFLPYPSYRGVALKL